MAPKQKKTVSQKLELDLPYGLPGVDEDPINPLARALDRITREGKPFRKVGTVLVDLPVNGRLYPFWLGTFVFSAGDRLVFFPGYAKSHGRLVRFFGGKRIDDTLAVIDHVTLEKDRDSWHMTTHGSKDHFSGAPSLPLSGEIVLWFGMSVAYPFSLHALRKKTLVQWSAPATDAQRRQDNIMQALRDVEHLRLGVVDESLDKVPKEHFYHFTVLVGNPDMLHSPPKEFAFPHGSPFVGPPLPHDDLLIRSASQIFELPSHCAIQITVTRLPGRLSLPLHFTGQTKPQANVVEMKILSSP